MTSVKNFNSPYSAAFSGGGFLFSETNALLPLLQSPDSEALLKDEICYNRILQLNKESSRSRIVAEVKRRYKAMPEQFWQDYISMGESCSAICDIENLQNHIRLSYQCHSSQVEFNRSESGIG